MVTDHTVLQREDGRNIVRGAAHHSKGLIACFQHGLLAGIHCHNAGLVEHNTLALLRNDNSSGTKIDTDIVLCHKFSFSFLWFLYRNNGLLMQAGNHTSLQYSIVAVKSIPVLNSFRLLTLFASTSLSEGAVTEGDGRSYSASVCSGGSSACKR